MANFLLLSRILHIAVFEDWGLKFLCLVFATLMWFYIDGELTEQRNFSVSIRASDVVLPAGYELSQDRPMPRFKVSVKGPRRHLQLMTESNIAFKRKELENPQSGRNTLSMSPADIEVEGVNVLEVIPEDKDAALELRKTVTLKKPVKVKPMGLPRPGFLVDKTRTQPPSVSIDGAAQDLDAIEFVWSEDVDVTGADQDVMRDVKIVPYVIVGGRRIDFRCNEKVKAIVPIFAVEVTRRVKFDIRTMALEGLALSVEPGTIEVEVVADERDFSTPDMMTNIFLYVEWPSNWERPKDVGEVLGPTPQQVKAISSSRVQVRGLNGGALPTVEVRGALAGVLKRQEVVVPK